jgi:hypothetical protein
MWGRVDVVVNWPDAVKTMTIGGLAFNRRGPKVTRIEMRRGIMGIKKGGPVSEERFSRLGDVSNRPVAAKELNWPTYQLRSRMDTEDQWTQPIQEGVFGSASGPLALFEGLKALALPCLLHRPRLDCLRPPCIGRTPKASRPCPVPAPL